MSTLESLVRLHNWNVDQARRKLSELYAEHQKLVQEGEQLEVDVAIEQAKSEDMEEGHFLYQNYIRSVMTKRETLEESIQSLEEQIDEAMDVARAAFREMKRVEVVQDHQLEQERQDALRRTQADLDEIAGVIYQRSQRN